MAIDYKSKLLEKGFFRLARNVSERSEYEHQIGAVIAKKRPISIGFNQIEKTHTKYNNADLTMSNSIHAEMSAIIHAKTDSYRDADIYIYRETSDGVPALAKPCENCMKNLYVMGIRRVYYTIYELPYWEMMKL
jgi:deoxycytidylate deaminase